MHDARKFSAVLGTTSSYSSMVMRPAALPSMLTSKNTRGLAMSVVLDSIPTRDTGDSHRVQPRCGVEKGTEADAVFAALRVTASTRQLKLTRGPMRHGESATCFAEKGLRVDGVGLSAAGRGGADLEESGLRDEILRICPIAQGIPGIHPVRQRSSLGLAGRGTTRSERRCDVRLTTLVLRESGAAGSVPLPWMNG